MVSTFTPNINLEQPARGDDVGVWDTPVNSNMSVTDLAVGGQTQIALNSSPVTLSAAQFQCKGLIFASTLTANVVITFPTSFQKSYEVFNACTGSSAFTVTLQTTVASGKAICVPPGEWIEMRTDSVNCTFRNLGRVGSYFDYAGSSVPNWVSGCTVPPYLNCDGSPISSSVYPVLFGLLGGTTPDARGRYRATLDQSVGRLSSAVIGFSPTTPGAGGGSQTATLVTANVPAHSHPVSDPGHSHGTNANTGGTTTGGGGFPAGLNSAATINTAVTNLTIANSTYANTPFAIIAPTYMGGITLIRAG